MQTIQNLFMALVVTAATLVAQNPLINLVVNAPSIPPAAGFHRHNFLIRELPRVPSSWFGESALVLTLFRSPLSPFRLLWQGPPSQSR